MKALRDCITQHVSVDPASLEDIVSAFEPRDIAKNQFLLRVGSNCREMYFIESGYLRMYDLADGKEVTLWIGSPGKFITSLSSFVFESENYWNIQAITDGRLFAIGRKAHFELCQRQPKWLEFDNKLLARSFALLERRMFSHLHMTAKQRLEVLLEEEPELFHHVPLQNIATLLGITPESLSRLRKNLTYGTS